MNKIILYSTHCPQCNILEKRLKSKGVDYIEVNDTDIMIKKGFYSAPMLDVNGVEMNFQEASEWLNKQ